MKNITKITTSTICSVSVIIGIALTNYADTMRTSKAGLEIIGNAEGCIREPYYCPANVLTVGVGSTSQIDHKAYSDDEIAKRWVEDINNAEQCVNRYASGKQLPPSVFDAMVSFTFNIGCAKAKNSTMFKYLNSDNYLLACHELPKWNKADGKVLNGLVIRRQKERELCLTDLN